MDSSFRGSLPTFITLFSLVCAFSAVVLAIHRELVAAGGCILVGYVLDAVDGEVARRLGVASPFGLQLDSLVDIVAFGVAPGVLVYQYLYGVALSPPIVWSACAGYLIAGAFRLARFNLLPQKQSRSDSLGLTISTSGATLALGVLSNCAHGNQLIPAAVFPLLPVFLALLMVSRVRYPALASIMDLGTLKRRLLVAGALGTGIALGVWLSPQLVGFGLTGGYVSFGLARAVYGLLAVN